MLPDVVRAAPIFAGLSDSAIDELCAGAQEVRLDARQQLFAQDDPADAAYIISEGELEILRSEGGPPLLQAVRGPGDMIGEMALVEGTPRTATVRARVPTVLLRIERDLFEALLARTPLTVQGALTIFRTILARWRETEQTLRLSQKLAALGSQTAGLVHEINNPTAAIRSNAQALDAALDRLQQASLNLAPLASVPAAAAEVHALSRLVRQAVSNPEHLDSLDRADREAEIEAWLTDQNIDDGWQLAPGLVAAGFRPEHLDQLASGPLHEHWSDVLEWLAALQHVQSLRSDIALAADRLADTVAAVKRYSHLDQAPVQMVNLPQSLDDTLTILQHKLKQGIEVRREYDPALPRIEGYPSELNQVWTNLIDNAADAAGPGGRIVVRATTGRDDVIVEVEDNGPGVPDALRERIFDPFFTTKPQGQGTGLGLPLVHNVVVNRHRGSVDLDSQPGRTIFRVRLPLRL
jgi:signal transduction histidine kinase